MTEPEALNTVHKWLNEDTGSVPRKEIAELCVEIRMLGERMGEHEEQLCNALFEKSELSDKCRELEAEFKRMENAWRAECKAWELDSRGDTVSGFMYWFFPSVILGILFWAWVLL